ncbi:MAG: sulfate adenylyltransferase [Limnohabitans sp.]|nr:sulfate adenylyltransferase [Limnohabitans sp.]
MSTLEQLLTPAQTAPALRFITCGSVDDGKSTLIGRLLVDTKAVLQDHLAGVQRQGQTDLALLTDGLSAEREQGITIDVAYRYFSTEQRKFIIGDAPGHEQYTRNMVTAASSADAAVVLVDATKLPWQQAGLALLPQTRRHALLTHLLRVPSIVFAINKLDAVEDPALAFQHIRQSLQLFAQTAGIQTHAIVPVSALKGWNVVERQPDWCGYQGPSLLELLERLPTTPSDDAQVMTFPVQWVEKFHDGAQTHEGRRVFWGRVASGTLKPGQAVRVFPSGQTAIVSRVMTATREHRDELSGHSGGVVLDREVDVSRGDWLVTEDSGLEGQRELQVTLAWMDDQPLVAGRVYWALQGHRWVKARVKAVVHQLDIHTLAEQDAQQLEANAIGHVTLSLQEPLLTRPYLESRVLGALVLVDTASHATAGAALVRA